MRNTKCNSRDGIGIVGRHAVPKPPEDFLLPGYAEAVLEVDVERITGFAEGRLTPVRTIIVELQRHIRRSAQGVLPASEEISTSQVGVFLHGGRQR